MKLITSEMDAETDKWQESSAQMEVSINFFFALLSFLFYPIKLENRKRDLFPQKINTKSFRDGINFILQYILGGNYVISAILIYKLCLYFFHFAQHNGKLFIEAQCNFAIILLLGK